MATDKLITMKQFNGTDYDTLYPKTIAEQVDGVYGKDEILNNSTKALYGLDSAAGPNDVFEFLGKYNLYWWKRRTLNINFEEVLGDATNTTIVGYTSENIAITLYYSDTINFDMSGTPYLINPQTVSVTTNSETIINGLKGKYIQHIDNVSGYRSQPNVRNVYYIPANAADATTRSEAGSVPRYALLIYTQIVSSKKTISYGNWEFVSSINRNAYPDSGIKTTGDYPQLSVSFTDTAFGNDISNSTSSLQYIEYSSVLNVNTSTINQLGELSLQNPEALGYYTGTDFSVLKGKYIADTSKNNRILYIPEDAEFITRQVNTGSTYNFAVLTTVQTIIADIPFDGYEYKFLGVPFDNAVNGAKIDTGSYIGTGTYGVSNPCSLTFGFSPSILIITGFMKSSGTSIGGNGSVVMNTSYGSYGESYSEYSISGTVVANGNQVQWYSENSASEQMNTDGSTYYYVAIG